MMLYPKKQEPLTLEDFQNPGSEYRGAPFWAWNGKLDKQTLLDQIDVFQQMGFGGFHMHVRTGMDTPYLSDEFMEMIKACNQKAQEKKMLSWLYDEDRWPSGAAGGFVTSDLRYRERFMRLSPYFKPEYETDKAAFDAKIAAGEKPLGYRLACYRITLKDGYLTDYQRLETVDHGEDDSVWYIYLELDAETPWYNNQTYVNTLDKAAIQRFIQLTHERYYELLGDQFSKSAPAIFTDEPQFKCKQTLDYAEERKEIPLPFTDDLPDTFRARYGYDLLDHLPELFWEPRQLSKVRYHYHDHLCDRFTEAFPKTIGDWCEDHHLALTGHVNAEQDLTSQTYSLGEAMRSYPHFQLPGIDLLLDRHEFSTLKQAQSCVHQCGREGMLSEIYGVTNWDYDFKGHKLQGDFQAALGVTIRVPHLSWMTMKGEAKRDYPASIFYQSPWYKEYPMIENHYARLNTAMTRGQCSVRVGVIHPIESFWLLWGPKQQTAAQREQAETNFTNLVEWLLFGLMDFDFISESLLPSQDGGGVPLKVGKMAYDVVVVPPCLTLRRSTVEILTRFMEEGGDVVFFGDPPVLVDALPSGDARILWESARHYAFDRIHMMDALAPYRTVEILNDQGIRTNHLLYQMRQEEDNRWLFISHVYRKHNWYEYAENVKIILEGNWAPTLYDTMTGTISPIPYEHQGGKTIINRSFYAEDSLLIRLVPSNVACLPAEAPRQYVDGYQLPEPEGYTLCEPNSLLLDMAEYSLNGEDYLPQEEILKLGNLVRARLGIPSFMENLAQPWTVKQTETPHDKLRLRITIHSDIECEGVRLALEIEEGQRILFNGQEVAVKPDGWFTDPCIQTVPLPALKKGENELILEMAFGKKTNTEWCYLLGDFGVEVRGCHSTVVAKPDHLVYGSVVPQGLPFYGGSITYHTSFESDGVHGAELWIPRYSGPVMTVDLDGKRQGPVALAPHTLDLGVLPAGRHTLDITLYGNRINAFGCVHCTDTEMIWFGPDCWRTSGNAFAYQYQLKTFGITQNPWIRTYESTH